MHIPLYTYIFISRYDNTQYLILVDIRISAYILCAYIYRYIYQCPYHAGLIPRVIIVNTRISGM